MEYVFISYSYSTKNRTDAYTMRKSLNDIGVKTWIAPDDNPTASR